MRKKFILLAMFLVVALPSVCWGAGVEIAVGGWMQQPDGDISYRALGTGDILDLESDLGYDDETRLTGRIKLDFPGPAPNIYLMATKMSFDGVGRRNASFKFGDQIFSANVDFSSEVVLDHYDIALFYGIPGVKEATLGKFNVEVGINVRILDLEAEVVQGSLRQSEDFVLPVPMLYLGVQLEPVEKLALEAEFRGLTIDNDHIYSLIARVKGRPTGPLFVAAGWRYEDLSIDEEDVKVEVSFSGPFAEVGVEF